MKRRMNMNNKLKKYYWIAGFILLMCLASVAFYPMNFGINISKNTEDWSRFGSYLSGVIGPLLSLLALIGVLYSIDNQNIENLESDKENKKLATENRIIKQIEFHHNICNNVKIPYDIKRTKYKEGRIAFEFLFEKHLKSFYVEEQTLNPTSTDEIKINNAFTKLYKKEGKQFGFYFRNLYYLIKYIDESNGIDKTHYSKLVRSQLSTPEIQMLMYNCLYVKGANFKNLVIEYGLLNGIDSTEMLDPNHMNLFDSRAFT